MPENVPALRLESVDWTPPPQPQGERPGRVLHAVSLTLDRGAVCFVLGNSGSGKTSLLKLANRLLDPDGGRVEVLGREVRQWDVRALRSRAVYVPQRPSLFAETVAEELRTPLGWHDRDKSDAELRHALKLAQLADLSLDRPTRGLSEGQCARLALARALLLEPALLLLDEPTASLDVRTSRELLRALRDWQRQHDVSILCVTHRVHELAELPGQALVLLDGAVAGTYSTEALLAGDTAPEVSAFLGTLEHSS